MEPVEREGNVRLRPIMYSHPTCSECAALRKFLAERGVAYMERDVSRDEEAAQEMRRRLDGRMVTPMLVVGDEVLVGFTQNRARLEALFPKGE